MYSHPFKRIKKCKLVKCNSNLPFKHAYPLQTPCHKGRGFTQTKVTKSCSLPSLFPAVPRTPRWFASPPHTVSAAWVFPQCAWHVPDSPPARWATNGQDLMHAVSSPLLPLYSVPYCPNWELCPWKIQATCPEPAASLNCVSLQHIWRFFS